MFTILLFIGAIIGIQNAFGRIVCTDEQFKCVTPPKCIPLTFLCDSKDDCADGADEKAEHCNVTKCYKGQFQCPANKACIPTGWLCDGDNDCGDNADERNCTSQGICESNELYFQCNNGRCIFQRWKCDDDDDCGDASDETNCTLDTGHVIKKRFDWHDEGSLHWSTNCDFFGNDLSDAQVPGERCGPSCESNPDCTHFTWTEHNGGTCWMKRGGTSLDRATYLEQSSVCGMMKQRGQGSQGGVNVKGTRWADTTDPGGCQMPSGNYAVQHALALGQSPDLGSLVWHQGLCGHVLRVNCGGSSVEAVVASTCNLGSGSCGVDLISKTWNVATGNKQPGIEQCKVELSGTNPLHGGGPLCYFRPTSGSSEYYASLGVFNTGTRIVQRATAAGVNGAFQSGSGWFDFNSNGRPLFGGGATVEFFFNDGSSNSFRLSDCRDGGNVNIWS